MALRVVVELLPAQPPPSVALDAVVAGLLWELAKYIFAWSLGYFHYDQIYGSVGAVVAVLTWGYVSSLILLYGAQHLHERLLNQVFRVLNRARHAVAVDRQLSAQWLNQRRKDIVVNGNSHACELTRCQ